MEQTQTFEGKKKWYKRWWMMPVYFIFAVSFIGALNDVNNAPATTSSNTAVNTQEVEESTPAPAPEAIKVTPSTLISEYEANGVAADAKYKDKLVEITGIVRSIDKDILDTPYIALETSEILSGVQCMFEKGDEAKLANVKKGQSITLQGNLSGKLGNVIVRDCVIVE